MRKLTKKIKKWIDANPHLVEEFWMEDDGFSENESSPLSIWLIVKPPYWNADSATQTIHEATEKDFFEAVSWIELNKEAENV